LEPDSKKNKLETADREKVKFRKELFIYLFFLLISVLSWYFIALGKQHTAYISYPVRYEKLPKGKVLVTDLPLEFKLRVSGVGFTILKLKIFRFVNPISIPLDLAKKDSSTKNYDSYELQLSELTEVLSKQLSSGLVLLNILPETLSFVFADVVDKKVPIKPILNLGYADQYFPYLSLIHI